MHACIRARARARGGWVVVLGEWMGGGELEGNVLTNLQLLATDDRVEPSALEVRLDIWATRAARIRACGIENIKQARKAARREITEAAAKPRAAGGYSARSRAHLSLRVAR